RHLETGLVRKADDLTGKVVEAVVGAVLVAGGEQQLQAQADAEERLAGAEVGEDWRRQPRFVQPGDGVAERADSRQPDPFAPGDPAAWARATRGGPPVMMAGGPAFRNPF